MAKTYNVPTSTAHVATVDPEVNRQTLKEIAARNEPVTMECFSPQCDGNTSFLATIDQKACPKCGSTSDAYRLGTFDATPDDDGLDATSYGDKAHDAVAPEPVQPKRKNANTSEGVREGFDVDQVRATVCRRNGWNWETCKSIFNVGAEVLTPDYFLELKAL